MNSFIDSYTIFSEPAEIERTAWNNLYSLCHSFYATWFTDKRLLCWFNQPGVGLVYWRPVL